MKKPNNTPWFTFENANPKNKKTSDCVVRAITLATGKAYANVLSDLVAVSLMTGYMVNDKKCYGRYLEVLGWTKCAQPRKPNGNKFTGREFCEIASGTVVAHVGGHHLSCFKEGTWHDTWDCTGKSVGNYWTK